MKILNRLFAALHGVIAVLFVCASLVLIAIAARSGWTALDSGLDSGAAQGIIEAIGLIAVAVVALQIAQTIMEEEVIRQAQVSAPTRVRRYLSRFLVVIVIALAVEGLVATIRALHDDLSQLPYAASLLISVAILLAGWGCSSGLTVPPRSWNRRRWKKPRARIENWSSRCSRRAMGQMACALA